MINNFQKAVNGEGVVRKQQLRQWRERLRRVGDAPERDNLAGFYQDTFRHGAAYALSVILGDENPPPELS